MVRNKSSPLYCGISLLNNACSIACEIIGLPYISSAITHLLAHVIPYPNVHDIPIFNISIIYFFTSTFSSAFCINKKYVIEVIPSVTNGAVSRSIKLDIDPTTKKYIPICFILLYLINKIIELANATKNIKISLIDFVTINMLTDNKPIMYIIPVNIFIFFFIYIIKLIMQIAVAINNTTLMPE